MFRNQCKSMLHKKSIQFVFLVNLAYAIGCFWYKYRNPEWPNAAGFWNYCGMGDNNQWGVFTMILCFVVAIPAMSFQQDLSDRILAAVWIRGSRETYLKSKMKAVFLTEFAVTVIPLLLNLILCLLFFQHTYGYYPAPYGNQEDMDQVLSTPDWTRGVTTPFLGLFKFCPVLYIILFLFFLGMFVGLIGMALLALSLWIRRFKIFLFLPVFALTKLGTVLDIWSYSRTQTSNGYRYINFDFWDYVSPISYDGKVYLGFFFGILLLCGFIYLSYRMICRKEYVDV